VGRLPPLRPLLAAASAAVLVAAGVAVVQWQSASPALALENGLARTPPMGFNNWNTTHCDAIFTEQWVRQIADFFVSSGLRDAGYKQFNIDDCWAEPQRNANGDLVPNRTRFPSGIRALADYVHARGMKFGIYTSAGTKTCNALGFPGALDNEFRDARLFASWTVDYLKYDNCNNQGRPAIPRYTKMRDALAATGRPIVYSITEWGQNQPWEWGEPVGNLWRTTGDINTDWNRFLTIFKRNAGLARFAGPGHWNDPDMLAVGVTRGGSFTAAQNRSHFSLWAIMAAPLLIGADVTRLSQANLALLTNRDVIAIDQDPLGRQADIVSNTGGRWIMSKPMADGSRAVALFNETTSTQTITTSASAVGLTGSGPFTLFDVWTKSSRGTTGTISASVPAQSTVMYRVSRSGAPGNLLEAEDATISQGVVESNHAGFSGTGFVNYDNVVGGFVEWRVNAATAGSATLRIRFANGSTANRPMDISVNGGPPVPVNFPATGAWTTWQVASLPATLTAGVNTVRATATVAAGGPNVDHLEVAPG
jgi:alpha-galactosidase